MPGSMRDGAGYVINDVLHENLTVERVDELIAKLPRSATIIMIRP